MPIVTYPLNNTLYNAEDAAMFNSTRSNGIYAGDDFKYTVTGADNNMTVDVGLAWLKLSRFNGVVVGMREKTTLAFDLPDPVFPRIDAVILKFDTNANATTLEVKKGAAQSEPQPPKVTRNEAVYELHLYHVTRKAGALKITSGDVTDKRLDPEYCGLMGDAITKVDTSAINQQVTGLLQELHITVTQTVDQTSQQATSTLDSLNQQAADLIKRLQEEIAGVESGAGVLLRQEKGAPLGVAELDGEGKVPADQLPSMNYAPLGPDGKIPEQYGGNFTKSAKITLSNSKWSGKSQKAVNPIFQTGDQYVYTVSPDPNKAKEYGEAFIVAVSVDSTGMVFTCEEVPSVDISVNISRTEAAV